MFFSGSERVNDLSGTNGADGMPMPEAPVFASKNGFWLSKTCFFDEYYEYPCFSRFCVLLLGSLEKLCSF